MVGGAVGNTVDTHRWGDPEDVLTGRLLGHLDGDEVDIAGKFKVQKTQQWTDKTQERKGSIGPSVVTHPELVHRFGEIPSDEYAFIYRFIGPWLHETESSDSFGSVLSRFAMGSATSDVNPVTIAKDLNKKADEDKKRISEIDKELRKIKDELATSAARPRRVAEIDAHLEKIEEQLGQFAEKDAERAREEEFLKTAFALFDSNEKLQQARQDLASTTAPSAEWQQAVENAAEIRSAISDITTFTTQVDESKQKASLAAAKIGISVEELSTRSFSVEDKSRLLSAGTNFGNANTRLEQAKDAIDRGSQLARDAMEKVSTHAGIVGLTSQQAESISSVIGAWNNLNIAAVTWSNAEDATLVKTVAWDQAKQNLDGARQRLEIERERQPGSGATSSRRSFLVPMAVLGVIGALGSFYSPSISVVAAIGILALLALSVRGRSASSGDAESESMANAQSAVSTALTALSIAEDGAKNAQIEADAAKFQFSTRLEPFGIKMPTAEIAQDLCQQIQQLALAVKELDDVEKSQRIAREELANAIEHQKSTREDFDSLCSSMTITYSGNVADLGEWIFAYDTAVTLCRGVADIVEKLSHAREELSRLLGDVSKSLSDLPVNRVLQEVDNQQNVARLYREAEKAVREAEIAASAAGGEKEEVRRILAGASTKSELQSRIDSLAEEARLQKAERDELVETRLKLRTEWADIENVEYINDIRLRQSRYEEEKREREIKRQSTLLAASTLSAVIDTFERENQGPLVTRANELLNSVVPGYGDLVYTRDESGKPVVERVNESSRLRTSKLSTGSRALAYIALRLAFVEEDQKKRGVALPVLCDDPLVHIDDQRAPEVMKILAQASAERQVILFTCHEDTRDLAVAAGAHVVSL